MNRPKGTSLDTITLRAYAVMGGTLIYGMIQALVKWIKDKPEWPYFRQFAELPLMEATGPDKAIFGYLPGCKAILAPFVLTGPAGYVVFALLNGLAVVGIWRFTYRNFSGTWKGNPLALLWLGLCSAVPVWMGLQNNQLVGPALFLTLLAMTRLREGKDLSMGGWIALAALVKTLPLAIMIFPLALGRWKAVLAAGFALGLLSVGLAAFTDGIRDSIAVHLQWPEQVAAQNPFKALDDAVEPKSFDGNQSSASEVVRLIQKHEWRFLRWIYWLMVGSSAAGLVVLSIRGIHDDASFWARVGGWLAWVAFSAPFGRYYYLIFLVPAVYSLGLRALAAYPGRRTLCLVLITVLVLTQAGSRGGTPVYALATGLALFIHLVMELRDLVRSTRRPESVEQA